MDQKKTSGITKQQAISELWLRSNISWKLKAHQKDLYDLFYNTDHKVQTWLLARRCLAEGTLIKTPFGLKKIEDIKVGDVVYGYNNDGSISETPVINTFSNGKKEVYDLCSSSRVLETCTLDHQWLTKSWWKKENEERTTGSLTKDNKIVRKYVDYKLLTGENEPHAYAIGALLGDGCSRQNARYTKSIYISSQDDIIPNKLANILNCDVRHSGSANYTWVLLNDKDNVKKGTPGKQVVCSYYKEWIYNRYAHQKIADLNVIKTWNWESQLNFLAGVYDTDGSFTRTKDNCLTMSIGMQSKSVIEACQYIIHNLFQFKTTLLLDNRSKYKNGPIYLFRIKNNEVMKRILKALEPYSALERKKWKPEYEHFNENNTNKDTVGVKIKNPRYMNTYDISIGNETNLYLTANGLVTHNCGKTFTLCLLAIEACLKQPNTIVKMLSPTRIQVQSNVRPLMRQILEDCPLEIKPEFKAKDSIYYFPNGSEIQLAGSEAGNADKLRGGYSHIAIVDEAQDVTDLNDAVKSVLLPTTLTTKGKIILAGTPPKNSDHDFIKFVEEAEHRGSLVKKTIYDNVMLSKEDIEEMKVEVGGENSEEWRREMLCHIIKDPSYSVIPEFTLELEKEIVREWPKPPFYETYESMDLGFKDLTVVLFAYYDFRADKVIIEDEIAVNGLNLQLPQLIKDIQTKEELLWTNHLTHEVTKPTARVSDINYIVTQEIARASGGEVTFTTAKKDDKEAAINKLRVLLQSKKIIIHPRCVTLIRHLMNVRWDKSKNKSSFARSPDDGHYDAVDACIYLIRHMNFGKNPYPFGYDTGLRREDIFVPNPDKFNNSTTNSIGGINLDTYKKIFGIKGRK